MSKSAALAIILALFFALTLTVEDAWAKGGGRGKRRRQQELYLD